MLNIEKKTALTRRGMAIHEMAQLERINQEYAIREYSVADSKHCTDIENVSRETSESDMPININHADIIAYIVDNSIHEKITVSIIKKMSANPKSRNNQACMNIVKSGYTDSILDDLKQEVYICLHELSEDKHVWIQGDKLVFGEYLGKDGKTLKSYYFHCYRAIEKYLYQNKYGNNNGEIVLESAISDCSESGKNERIVGARNQSYEYRMALSNKLGENALEMVCHRTDIKSFFRHIEKTCPKNYSDIYSIFTGLIQGHTYSRIAKNIGITERRVKYLISVIRNEWEESCIHVDIKKTEKTEHDILSAWVGGNGSVKTASHYKYIKMEARVTIKRVKLSETTYPSCPLYVGCGKVEIPVKHNVIDTDSANYTNVYDTKRHGIRVLDSNGKDRFFLKFAGGDEKCFIKKHNLYTV